MRGHFHADVAFESCLTPEGMLTTRVTGQRQDRLGRDTHDLPDLKQKVYDRFLEILETKK
jgi:hypothetical protein